MGLQIKAGSINRSVRVRVLDSADGTPETGIVYNTAGIALWYQREGGLKVPIAPASLSALTDAHADGGFLHISDGYCRVDVPDAAWAAGSDSVLIGGSATDMVFVGNEVQLIGYDPRTELTTAVLALIDAAITSRAAPGDEMDLIPNALDADAVDPSGATEIADAITSGIEVEVIFPQAVATMAAALVGDRMTITRDSDFTALIPVQGGISATRDDSLFTAKTEEQVNTGAADNQALIQVSETGGGLIYLNGDDGEGLILVEGTLTVVDELDDDGVGWFRLDLTSWAASQLERRTGSKFLKWDYKTIEAGADLQRVKGDLDIVGSVARTISP